MGSFGQSSFPLCSTGLNSGDVRVANVFTNSFHQAVPYQEAHQCGWLNSIAAPEAKSLEFLQQQQRCYRQTAVNFTNGRKRSCDTISSEDMKKVKTEICFESSPMETGQSVSAEVTPKIFHNGGSAFCFPNSVIEHQSVVYAEQNYHVSLLENIVADYHGC